jgi:hypothetical protein
MEKILATFSGFHQTLFSFLTARSPQQLFSQPQPNQTDPKLRSSKVVPKGMQG